MTHPPIHPHICAQHSQGLESYLRLLMCMMFMNALFQRSISSAGSRACDSPGTKVNALVIHEDSMMSYLPSCHNPTKGPLAPGGPLSRADAQTRRPPRNFQRGTQHGTDRRLGRRCMATADPWTLTVEAAGSGRDRAIQTPAWHYIPRSRKLALSLAVPKRDFQHGRTRRWTPLWTTIGTCCAPLRPASMGLSADGSF